MPRLEFETVFNNRNLFSNHYLQNLIHRNLEWRKNDHEDAFRRVKEIYQAEKARLDGLTEPQLEKSFFRKVFSIILPHFEVQAVTETQEFPDYAFFPDQKMLEKAHESKGTKSFYVNAFAIGEVKRWDVELDRFGRDRHDKRRNPSFQIWLYLHDTEPKWGILSNGRKWRLYHQDKPLDCYYEIDLVELLEQEDVEGFRYFYYFFRQEAFLPAKDGEIFLEKVLRESADYAREIGDNLKENVYRAMKKIADGFFKWSQNELDPTDNTTRFEVQKSTMRLLYRLLFLLYAEGKGLLSLRNEEYRSTHSFDRLKKEIKSKKDGPASQYYSSVATTLWSRLKDLFRLIDRGSESFRIPREQFYVPAYNGGLFDQGRNPNLEKWTIGDTYLADAIDLLARSQLNSGGTGFVDYSTLDIRHLGSIYEGLLEYKLRIATEEMVVRGGGKKREWVTLEEFNKHRKRTARLGDFDEFDMVKAGELYLATEKGERKATGSYYTPDYVVSYIVEKAVGPALEQKLREAVAKNKSLVDAVLSVKVLDPAMGSGHFLVGVVDYLAGKLLKATQRDIENGLVEDDGHFTTDWAKREVVSHCVYGVDLNDLAVELAKVSLWLTTISRDKPLSFLDHRLKQGNSLVGTDLNDLPWHPLKAEEKERKDSNIPKSFIKKLVDSMRQIMSIADDSLENIRRKEDILGSLRAKKEYDMIKTLADVRVSIHFGNEVDEDTYGKYSGDAYWSSDAEWQVRRNRLFAKKAREIAERNHFFHWELEFPEVFFESGTVSEAAGFDAVVGNPPYFLLQGREEQGILSRLFPHLFSGSDDVSYYFMVKGLDLTAKGGRLGYIVTRYWMDSYHSHRIRQRIIEESSVEKIVDFQNFQAFGPDVNVLAVVVVLCKDSIGGRKDTDLVLLESSTQLCDREVSSALESETFPFRTVRIGLPTDGHEPWNLSKLVYAPTFDKISRYSHQLGDLTLMTQGIKSGRDDIFVVDESVSKSYGLEDALLLNVAQGETLRRHELLLRGEYLIYTHHSQDISEFPRITEYLSERRVELEKRAESDILPYWALQRPRDRRIVMSRNKILSKRISTKNAFVCTSSFDDVIVGLGDINMIVTAPDSPYKPEFLCAILNAKLLDWVHKRNTKLKRAGYYDYSQYNIARIPIRRIHFSTPEEEHVKYLNHLITLYESGNSEAILATIDSHLPRNERGEFLAFVSSVTYEEAAAKGFIDHIPAGFECSLTSGLDETGSSIERSDVIHDFLAYLAGQMMETNKSKNKEIKEFLEWLEREIRVEIGILTNRTKLWRYYDLEFDGLLQVLKQNRKRIPISPTNREFLKDLLREYERSMSVLLPLRRKIEDTDDLIDQIVNRLYGLAEDEVEIVEKSDQYNRESKSP